MTRIVQKPILPRDRAFWADNGYGEIVRVEYSPDNTGFAPEAMFAPLDDGGGYGGELLIGESEVPDWDDDREALASRIEASWLAASRAAEPTLTFPSIVSEKGLAMRDVREVLGLPPIDEDIRRRFGPPTYTEEQVKAYALAAAHAALAQAEGK